jgi:hypothetical protein
VDKLLAQETLESADLEALFGEAAARPDGSPQPFAAGAT